MRLQTVLRYHTRTKHHLHRFARSLGYMDWSTQPDPFRRYEGASVLPLQHPSEEGPLYDELFRSLPPARGWDGASVSALLYDSFALSAWKSAGTNRWALRVNPSSGNLHPTEVYLLAGPTEGLCDRPALYHYAPMVHGLELRAELDASAWNELSLHLPPQTLLVGLSSVVWREAWKYGERAYRYCQHDVGHALGALAVAAANQGRVCRPLEELGDEAAARLLGVARQRGPEAEHPDLLVAVYAPDGVEEERSFLIPSALVDVVEGATLRGRENELSPRHHGWPILDEIREATTKGALDPLPREQIVEPPEEGAVRPVQARALVRRRRSAVAMDGETEMSRDEFFRMMQRLGAAGGAFGAWPWPPEVHLVLLIHRVRDVAPGLYVLVRNASQESALRGTLDEAFAWARPQGCPASLHLRMLMPADVRELARTVSCHQDIAADGAFAVAMVARYRSALEQRGPWYYRRLFWEAGMLGQMLYLEAEAAGLQGTGIGCFFDDAMHQVLGIRDDSFQSLYHFTVGRGVEDHRLGTHPAYEHLEGV